MQVPWGRYLLRRLAPEVATRKSAASSCFRHPGGPGLRTVAIATAANAIIIELCVHDAHIVVMASAPWVPTTIPEMVAGRLRSPSWSESQRTPSAAATIAANAKA